MFIDESIYFNQPIDQISKLTNIFSLIPEVSNTELYSTIYNITHLNTIFCDDLIKQNPIGMLREQLDEEYYDDL